MKIIQKKMNEHSKNMMNDSSNSKMDLLNASSGHFSNSLKDPWAKAKSDDFHHFAYWDETFIPTYFFIHFDRLLKEIDTFCAY